MCPCRILSFPRNLLSARDTRRGLAAAFRMWSEVSPFSFREVPRHLPSDLKIGESPPGILCWGRELWGVLIPEIPVGNPGFGRQESSPELCGLSSASWIRFGVSFRQAEKNCFCLLKEILMSQLTLSVNGGWEVSGICQE